MRTIIMLHGHPLSGKSTAAGRIRHILGGNGIKSEVIKSVLTRYGQRGKINFTEDEVDENIGKTRKEKDKSYRDMIKMAENMEDIAVPILDATFHKQYRREWVYELSEKIGAKIIVLWMVFGDDVSIKTLLDERQKTDSKDGILKTFRQYRMMKGQTDSIEDDDLKDNKNISMIKFDRAKNSFDFYNCGSDEPIIPLICKAIGGI